MALFASQLLTAASGSVGGLTFLPTPGGMALRAKAIPVDPATSFQVRVRRLHAYLVSFWIENLNEDQRHGWATYAHNTPRLNALGQAINIGALPMWIRSQLPRLQAGLPILAAAPIIFEVGAFTPIVPLFVVRLTQRLRFTFNGADTWATQRFSAMLIYIARPQNQSVNFFKGPYRFAAALEGSPLVPPVSPANVPVPFPVSLGQKVFFRVTATLLDGRYSGTQRASALVT